MPWLMKAEPDSRIVKGKDVKFSVDDFSAMGVSPWDGVRSFEARNIMRDKMKMGDKVLFYHSNTKLPGVQAIAEVAREGYPDYTAWDPAHPYYDATSEKDAPKWFMVDVKFMERFAHPPSLALIKALAASPTLPDDVSYIGPTGLQAIKDMQLVNRGRLSVQPVSDDAFGAISKLGRQGGWEGLVPGSVAPTTGKRKSGKRPDEDSTSPILGAPASTTSKRKTSKRRDEDSTPANLAPTLPDQLSANDDANDDVVIKKPRRSLRGLTVKS